MQIDHLKVHPTESHRSSVSWTVVFKSAHQLVHHNHLKPFKTRVLSNFSLSDGEYTKRCEHGTTPQDFGHLI